MLSISVRHASCGGSTAPAPASSGSPAVDPATAGTITGRVVVEGTPPKAQTIRVAMHHLGTDEELDGYVRDVDKVVRQQQAIRAGQQFLGEGDAEGDGLARPSLGGNQKIAARGLGGENGLLNRGQRGIAPRFESHGQRRGNSKVLHIFSP